MQDELGANAGAAQRGVGVIDPVDEVHDAGAPATQHRKAQDGAHQGCQPPQVEQQHVAQHRDEREQSERQQQRVDAFEQASRAAQQQHADGKRPGQEGEVDHPHEQVHRPGLRRLEAVAHQRQRHRRRLAGATRRDGGAEESEAVGAQRLTEADGGPTQARQQHQPRRSRQVVHDHQRRPDRERPRGNVHDGGEVLVEPPQREGDASDPERDSDEDGADHRSDYACTRFLPPRLAR